MEVVDIIKDSLKFPADNIKQLAIYILLTIVIAVLLVGAIVSFAFTAQNVAFIALGVLLIILAIVVYFIMAGYQMEVLKTGLKHEIEIPDVEWKGVCILGLKKFVVDIVYMIIPTIITLIVFFLTASPAIYTNLNPAQFSSDFTGSLLFASLSITLIVAFIVYLIFAFVQTMAFGRLAKTDSLGNALNIVEAVKDISRVGAGKVIITILLLVVINVLITGILSSTFIFAVLNIIAAPYLMFAFYRGNGLLYADLE